MIFQDDANWLESWLMTDFVQDFLTLGGIISIGEWEIPILGIVFSLLVVGLVILCYKIIISSLNKRANSKNYSPNMLNGIRFILRVFVILSLFIVIVNFLNVNSAYILIFAGIFTTAVAFASMKSINNFIAGIWLTIVHPFNIGDYVEISDVEGIITEISLNYIKVEERNGNLTVIPNINCLSSRIVNYTISVKEFQARLGSLEDLLKSCKENINVGLEKNLLFEIKYMKSVNRKITKLKSAMKKSILDDSPRAYSKYARKNKIIKYTFTLELPRTPKRNEVALDSVCDEWESIFQIAPIWEVSGITAFIIYRFTIYTVDPEDIVEYVDEFIKNVYQKLF